ncbi:MAG: conserved phage C-terminal domain-containing protein [Oliverpabstia sp.]
MSQMAKKYYWLKLPNTYFSKLEQKKMRKQKNGRDMQVIYLRMMLLSINNGGRIYYRNVYDTIEEELAEEFDEDIELVRNTIEYLLDNKMISIEDSDIFIPEAEKLTGSECYSAERVRRHRENKKALQCNSDVTASNSYVTACNEEIEIDIEIENREKNNYIVEQSPTSYPFQEIIDYLNQKTGKKFKSGSKANQKHIKARFSEGFTLEDFKRVIDLKCEEWSGSQMEMYLRPETLFGSKFDSYLNACPAAKHQVQEQEEIEESVDYSQMDRRW